MQNVSQIDELIDLRAEIARLRRREASLAAQIEGLAPPPMARAGWPLQISNQNHARARRHA